MHLNGDSFNPVSAQGESVVAGVGQIFL